MARFDGRVTLSASGGGSANRAICSNLAPPSPGHAMAPVRQERTGAIGRVVYGRIGRRIRGRG